MHNVNIDLPLCKGFETVEQKCFKVNFQNSSSQCSEIFKYKLMMIITYVGLKKVSRENKAYVQRIKNVVSRRWSHWPRGLEPVLETDR